MLYKRQLDRLPSVVRRSLMMSALNTQLCLKTRSIAKETSACLSNEDSSSMFKFNKGDNVLETYK